LLTLAQAYEGLRASDDIIAKAAKISEVAQIARTERRMREYLDAEWEKRAKKATEAAAKMAAQGKTAKQITTAVDKIMNAWAGAIKPVFLKEVDRIYRLARTAGHKKANRQTAKPLVYDMPKFEKVKKAAKGQQVVAQLLPAFDLVDESAVAALQNHQVFWMGDLYKKGVSPEIAKITRQTMIEAGGDPSKAAKLMKERMKTTFAQVKVPAGFTGTTKQYFEGVAANAATTARVHGQMRSFMSIGITTYTISNPGDQRTCPRCSHMDGKVFTVRQGADQMQSVMSATTPDQVKAAHPWPTESQLKSVSPKPGPQGAADSKALSAANITLPPFHFRCRCTVDVNESSGSYDNLTPMTVAAAPNPARLASVAAWSRQLTSAEQAAFDDWGAAEGYDMIRRVQAGKVPLSEVKSPAAINAQKSIDGMESALARAPHYEGTIHRGMVLSADDATTTFAEGNVLTQDSYTSWSKSRSVAKDYASTPKSDQRYVLLKVKTKNGTHDISKVATWEEEKEVLMNKGKRLVVKDREFVSKMVSGKRRYGMEVTLVEADDAALPVLKPKPKPKPSTRLKTTKTWEKSLSKAEKDAFGAWSGQDFAMMKHIDSGRATAATAKAHPESVKRLKDMRAALSRAPVHKGKVYRGMYAMDADDVAPFVKKGNVIEHEALTSWSAEPSVAATAEFTTEKGQYFVIMETNTSSASYNIAPAAVADEAEVILDKGKRLLVQRVRKIVGENVDGEKVQGFHVLYKEL